ncbi:MAG: ATP-dependent helicase HrpB [Gemmatimonadetes bacterium]|nr:ATP-dependent helicase HrpB [Gemmatimonadota bacterium]
MVQAPPGAGKTTLVPLALLDSAWLRDKTIVMLEPRRLATRAAAHRIAELHGEQIGGTVGYRMRGDSRVGPRTRIEVVTEGILTRRLQRDPTLDGVGLVIFDEFHERSLHADLGLALTRRTQALVRDDLRLLVMSATLDVDAVARLLGGAPVIASEGRMFPVDTRYIAPRSGTRTETAVSATVAEAIRSDDGDVLVFLPGAGEIRRVESLLADRDLQGAAVLTLYGAMIPDAQDRALRPDPTGRRKIVLSTSIAETSLTIEGVRIVIDSGLSRAPRFSPRTGMTRLETMRVSRASADQRRGRAGRLGPGVCYRLWPEHENLHLLANTPPEITSADLAPLALDLVAAGVSDPLELDWIDPPAPAAYAQALELLRELDAVDASSRLTAHGREMNALPVHPRLGHMLLRARDLGATALACDLAALLSERDILRGIAGPIDADVGYRVLALRAAGDALPLGAEVDRDAMRRARTEADRLARQLGAERTTPQPSLDMLGVLLALAYPDRVAQRRTGARPRYVLRNGRGAELTGAQSLSESPYIVAAELDDQRPESRVFLAAAVTIDEIRAAFGDQIVSEDVVEFDDTSSAVVARRRERLGAIVLRDVSLAEPNPASIADALVGAVRRRGIASLPWSDAARALRERMAFVARHDASWPDVSDEALVATLGEWLGPLVTGVRRLSDLARVDLVSALLERLDWKQRRALDELAPTHIEVPSGSHIRVDYTNPSAPVLAVRIQEVFGLTESPRLVNGRVPVTMHLLSPAQRPVQVTQDLAGFWRTSYFDVRKDLRGRYPKHEWPENPLEATPTRRAKPRG